MKNNKLFYLAFAIAATLLIGCNGNKENKTKDAEKTTETEITTSTDYSGVYKSNQDGEGCDLTITLTKENDGYKYFLTGEHHDQEGKAIIEKTDAVYITFDGPIGNNKPNTVSGQIEGNTMMFQNYGNANNEYHFFVDCDEKFIEFVK